MFRLVGFQIAYFFPNINSYHALKIAMFAIVKYSKNLNKKLFLAIFLFKKTTPQSKKNKSCKKNKKAKNIESFTSTRFDKKNDMIRKGVNHRSNL
jgi:hypothetical protein